MAREHADTVRQREQPLQRVVQLPGERFRIAAGVQIRPTDVADRQRIAGEDEPEVVSPATKVRDAVSVVSRSMTWSRKRADVRVPELDDVAVGKRLMGELDGRVSREVRRCAGCLDERGQPRHVVCLHVRLENRGDRRARTLRLREVAVDERFVRVDDGEPPVSQAAEEVRAAGGLVVEERAQDHGSR